MRLAASIPIPFVSAGIISLATWISATAPIASMAPPDADLASPVETVRQREQEVNRTPAVPDHSVWKGTYVCLQGLASVTLTIDVEPSGIARARYDFGPVPSNPTVPKTGAFLLVGSLQHVGSGFSAELDARTWIVRPDNYFMVPLSIASDDGRHIRGRIHHESCSQFQATRIE